MILNKNEETQTYSLSVNTLKPALPTEINTICPKSPDSEASPIIDLSMSENDPLLHIKNTNSFYHSSVTSESKKYNSFITPISPIVSEKSSVINKEYDKDENNENKKYTNHLLANENTGNNINDQNIESDGEENDNHGPSKVFNTDMNKVVSGSRFNNPISISVDNGDGYSSRYNSAKIPLSVMTVVQDFEPRMEDELTLRVNDRILLLKVFDDGWAVGLNQMTGKQGVFPMEYVVSSELIKSSNKFASQIEYRNALPSRTQSQAFSNFSFTSTTLNDSIIHITDSSDFDSSYVNMSKFSIKSSDLESLKKTKLNNSSIIDD